MNTSCNLFHSYNPISFPSYNPISFPSKTLHHIHRGNSSAVHGLELTGCFSEVALEERHGYLGRGSLLINFWKEHHNQNSYLSTRKCSRSSESLPAQSDVEATQATEIYDIVHHLAETLQGEPVFAAKAASHLVAKVNSTGRAAILMALFASSSNDAEEYFKQADSNSDGVLDKDEFATYVEAQAVKFGTSTKELTSKQILLISTRAAIGALGFGFIDNAVMILAGDAIQNTIGVSLGLSTLLSAGLGNALADLVGTAFKEYIESISSKFMPASRLSPLQMEFKEAYWAEVSGACVGVTTGCILGLSPLLFLQPANLPPQEGGTAFATVATSQSGRGAASSRKIVFSSCGMGNNVVPPLERERKDDTCFASTSTSWQLPPTAMYAKDQSRAAGVFMLTISIAVAGKYLLRLMVKRHRGKPPGDVS